MTFHASLIIFPVLNVVSLILTITMYTVTGLGFFPDGYLIKERIRTVFQTYKLEAEPSSWVFVLWIVNYVYQLLWVMYSLLTICRGGGYRGFPAYMDPQYIPNTVVYASIVCSILSCTWVVLFTRHMLVHASVLLFVTTPLQFLMIGVLMVSLSKAAPDLDCLDRMSDVWFTRLLMIEGMCVQATLSTITTIFNFGIVCRYSLDVGGLPTAVVSQLIVLLAILVWFVLDFRVLDKHTRYVVSPYVIVCIMQLAIVTNAPLTPLYSNALLTVYTFAVLFKVAMLIRRHRSREPY